MVKYYRQILSLLGLILALSASGNSQTDIAGWRAARWGMSDSDILGTFGTQLKTLSKPQRFHEQHVDLIIPDFKINDHLFTVFFKMDDRTDKLIEVLIRLNEMKSRNRRDDLFSELEMLLIKDYGAPGSKVNKKENPLAKYEYWDLRRIWRLPTTTVELDYLWDNSSYASILGIKYFPTHQVSSTMPNKSLDASGINGLVIDNLSVTWLSPAASTPPFDGYRYGELH